MKRLKEYIIEFSPYPNQVILKRFKRGIYYQGKVQTIPEKFTEYFVLAHSNLKKYSCVSFVIVEGV